MSKRAEDKGGEPTTIPKNRRTRTHWQALVDAWQQSNQTQRAFCQELGLCYQQFSKWKRRLKSEALADPDITKAAFIPVHCNRSFHPNIDTAMNHRAYGI